jgi:aerobic carbon-monoxide dehydrogenase medium subunit
VKADVMTHRPESLDAMLALLAEHGDDSKIVAGGTAFTILWRAGLIQAGHLMSCAGLCGLSEITDDGDSVVIGALATFREAETSEAVRSSLPVLAAALRHVANVRVRNVATWGGNAAEADNTSDLPCLLVALDAEIEIASVSGTRVVGAGDFFTDYFQTVLTPEEFIVRIRVPRPSAGWAGCYVKFVSRSAEDRTCIGVAALARVVGDGTCQGVRVAATGVAPVPLRVPHAERALHGAVLTDSVLEEFAHEYVGAADPLSDIRGSAEYRKRVLPGLVTEALARVVAGGNEAVLR